MHPTTALLLLLLPAVCLPSTRALRIGVLFGSFGDVESCQCVDSYFKGALQRLVGYEIPVHNDIERVAIADLVWSVSKKETFEMWVSSYRDAIAFFASYAAALAGIRPFPRSAIRRLSRGHELKAMLSSESCARWVMTLQLTPPTTSSKGLVALLV
jgi:hypothetical protein